MKLTQIIDAPAGAAFSRFAFHTSLGTPIPLRVDGEVVGDGTLVGAITGERNRSIVLVYDVDGLDAALWYQWAQHHRRPRFDLPPYEEELNPKRALEILDAAIAAEHPSEGPPEWTPLGLRLHEALCGTEHPRDDPDFSCVRALNLCYDWLSAVGLDAGAAISRDARVGYVTAEGGR